MVVTAATTPGSFDSDAPSYSDDPAAMSQSSITSSTSSAVEEYEESITSTPKRYPVHLTHGSAPRQRQRTRPNSGRYETMEELLAAAGYSETRVFTPEGERVKRLAHDWEDGQGDGQETLKIRKMAEGSGIGRLVTGLIAHIMPVGPGVGASGGSTREPTPVVRVQLVEDAETNPFLETSSPTGTARCAYPQAAQSLRTHLLSAHTIARTGSVSVSGARSTGHHRAQPALRHTTSAPSLPRISSSRRRALPSAWRDTGAPNQSFKPWSGGFVPKTVETHLKPRSGSGWFGSVRPSDTRAQTSPAGTIRPRTNTLRPPIPTLQRARSAPRSISVHVPLPGPPVRPSPVVQQNTVVCRSQPILSSSVRIQSRSKSRTRGGAENDDQPSPILAPEPGSTFADGLPPTPARPVLHRARSNGLLRRSPNPMPVEDEPDLAAIMHAFRPSPVGASSSPTRRQRSIRSLRALLKDPRFPDVPVVCVASPGTVGVGGPGRALWMSGPGWEAEVRRKNVFNEREGSG